MKSNYPLHLTARRKAAPAWERRSSAAGEQGRSADMQGCDS
jgi:hypothetical protein